MKPKSRVNETCTGSTDAGGKTARDFSVNAPYESGSIIFLLDAQSHMSENGQSQLRNFGRAMLMEMRGGTFDPHEVTLHAPQELQFFADRNSISLELVFSVLNCVVNEVQEAPREVCERESESTERNSPSIGSSENLIDFLEDHLFGW